jgi:hypothetical protein
MRVSVPFGYYRHELGQLTSTPMVEFIDADVPELSSSDVQLAATYSKYHSSVDCLAYDGGFLIPLDSMGRPFDAADMPTPENRRSPKAFQLLALMPMQSGEPIHSACSQALSDGSGSVLSVGEPPSGNRNGRIERATRAAESFVLVGREVWRKAPEPKLKLTVRVGRSATIQVYFGGVHRDKNGKSNFEGEYILPLSACDEIRDFAEAQNLNLQGLETVERIVAPDLFTFSASVSLAESSALFVLRELEKHVGQLDGRNIARWMDLRTMATPFDRIDHSVWNDIRSEFSAREILEVVRPIVMAVPDAAKRNNVLTMMEWASHLDDLSKERRRDPLPFALPGR